MNKIKYLAVFIVAAVAAGCASTRSTYSTTSSVDGRTRFALVRAPEQNSAVDEAMLQALYDGFKSYHYVPSRPNAADFVVSYRVLSVSVPPDGKFRNGYAGPGVYTNVDLAQYYFPGNNYVYRTDTGVGEWGREMKVLLLTVRDIDSGKVLWRGWQMYGAREGLSPARTRQMIGDILDHMPKNHSRL